MKPVITALDHEDIEGWCLDLDRTQRAGGSICGVGLFSNAIQVWSCSQGRTVTIQEAALAFNVRPDLVREAVEHHYWMFLGAGDVIEHEGE